MDIPLAQSCLVGAGFAAAKARPAVDLLAVLEAGGVPNLSQPLYGRVEQPGELRP